MNIGLRMLVYGVSKWFPDVDVISTENLEEILDDCIEQDIKGVINDESRNILLVDIREKEEYEASHLTRSQWVDFNKPMKKQFEDLHQLICQHFETKDIEKKEKLAVVGYCAVGFRASWLLSYAQKKYRRLQYEVGSSVDPPGFPSDDDSIYSMGQGTSYFTEEEQAEILEETVFNPRELLEIQKRYSKLDKSQSSKETYGVMVEDLMKIPELTGCKLARLVAEKFAGRTQTFYPKEAVLFFNELSSHKSPEEKVDFLFKLLDVKSIGYLSGIEMYRFYHTLLSPGLNDQQVKEITENLLEKTGGQITLQKFKEIFPPWEVAEKLTVDLQLHS